MHDKLLRLYKYVFLLYVCCNHHTYVYESMKNVSKNGNRDNFICGRKSFCCRSQFVYMHAGLH